MMKLNLKPLKIIDKKPKDSDSCVNCYYYANRSDIDPCFSCTRNPQTHVKDNWTGYEHET